MTQLRAQLSSLVALSLLVAGIVALARLETSAQQLTLPNVLTVDPALKEIANYRQWTRVNEKPVMVMDPTSIGA